MQSIGWSVESVELDASAAEVARTALSGPVHVAGFREAGLDAAWFRPCHAVTMRHVVEHVPDPLVFHAVADAVRLAAPDVGEEALLVAEKPGDGT
jgi:2-polyprenyl-3-methyl-5-hydroxy-6-metoxy-1,4-benzoquinol methylase